MPFKYSSMQERIIANTVLAVDSFFDGTPCWLWLGAYSGGGRYPKLTMRWRGGTRRGKVRTVAVHRLVISVFKGRYMGPKYVAKHLCNNRACVNPWHLSGGTQRSNVKQCVKQGRHGNQYRAPVRDSAISCTSAA